MTTQTEFDFNSAPGADGHTAWLAGRMMAAAELARRMHLPLDHQVEVWLLGGLRLRGLLKLREEMLFLDPDRVRHLELEVDHVGFSYRDLESCVRLD